MLLTYSYNVLFSIIKQKLNTYVSMQKLNEKKNNKIIIYVINAISQLNIYYYYS